MAKRNKKADWFVRAMAAGDVVMDSESACQMSEQLGVRLSGKYYCIVARYKQEEQPRIDANLTVLLYEGCLSALKNLEGYSYCYIGNQLYIVIVLEDMREKTSTVLKLKDVIEKNCGKQVQLGVGRSYCEIEKLNYSRVEAYESLANVSNQDEISYIEDLYVIQNITSPKLDREKQGIISQFKRGELQQAMDNVARLVEKVRSESLVREGAPYPTSIRRTIIELLVEILHFCADADVDVDAVLDYQDPYRRILDFQTTPEIMEWFFGIMHILRESVTAQNRKTERNLLTSAKRIIDEHIFESELSLTLVGEHLGITPTYLSAFFIREMGIGFNEYISTIRIEYAKEQLLKTNKKINVIALMCGFSSTSYFIAVFRKHVGMSPGVYRSMKK